MAERPETITAAVTAAEQRVLERLTDPSLTRCQLDEPN